jgi:hypothetical protein
VNVVFSVANPLHVLEQNLLAAAAVKFRRLAVGVASYSLSGFQSVVIFQKIRDACRPERVRRIRSPPAFQRQPVVPRLGSLKVREELHSQKCRIVLIKKPLDRLQLVEHALNLATLRARPDGQILHQPGHKYLVRHVVVLGSP